MADLRRPIAPESATNRDLRGAASAFDGDDGSVPADVAEVLIRRATGRAAMREVVAVLARHRLLVPLLEVDGDLLEGDDADPCAGQDRAVAAVSMRTRAGSVGLAFTGLAPMAAWDPRARPMPTDASRVAAALLAEGGIGLLVDAAAPTQCRIEGQALRRLAAESDWPEPWLDPLVRQAVVAELAPALASGEISVRLAPSEAKGDPMPGGVEEELLVELRFPVGTSADLSMQRAASVADRLARSGTLRAVFDGVLAVSISS